MSPGEERLARHRELFGTGKLVIGMLHIPGLPGSPRNALDFDQITDWVLADARALARGGVDALLLENFGDVLFYPRRVPPHTVAFMSALASQIVRDCDLPLGINVLRNDAQSALAIAAASGARFIRVNVHTGARVTDQGVIEGVAHETLRYRHLLGYRVNILADVQVKHSAALAARDLADDVEEMVARGCADAIIVSGSGTGPRTALEDLQTAKAAAGSAPVLAGSGADPTRIRDVLAIADGVIAGTALKRDGIVTNPVDPDRVAALMQAARYRLV